MRPNEDRYEELLGTQLSASAKEDIKRVLEVFNGELLHRWDYGQIVEKDRLLDYLIHQGGVSVQLYDKSDEAADLAHCTPEELADNIDSILQVLVLVCRTSEKETALLEGRIGFCKGFDELSSGIRSEAIAIAHRINSSRGQKAGRRYGGPSTEDERQDEQDRGYDEDSGQVQPEPDTEFPVRRHHQTSRKKDCCAQEQMELIWADGSGGNE